MGAEIKMRGCIETMQVLSLVLLGQMEMLKESSGLMVALLTSPKLTTEYNRG